MRRSVTADSLQLTVQVILSGVFPGSCSGVRTPPPNSGLRPGQHKFPFPEQSAGGIVARLLISEQ
jgi:hypothetical protein